MIKNSLLTLLLGTALVCAAENPAGVPKEATQTGPRTWRFVDKDNKVWIYRQTPFGFQKSAENAAGDKAAPGAPEAAANRTATPFGESKSSPSNAPVTKVTEDGDTLRFERPTPFGNVRWSRKKSELTDDERKIWEAKQGAPSAAEQK